MKTGSMIAVTGLLMMAAGASAVGAGALPAPVVSGPPLIEQPLPSGANSA